MALPLTAFLLSPFLAQAVTFNMLSCCPGEDTATEARFVWHSDSNACQLWYAKASAPGEAVQATCESVYKPITFRSSDVSYYKYTAALSSLDPGTEYIYWVEAGGSQSGVQRFKTAGTSGSYNFLWLSDVHSHPDDSAKTNSVNTIIANAKSAAGSLDFILFSGDMVKFGARYDNWQQWNGNASFTEYMHALCPGNKEYYYNGSQTGVNGTSNRIHNKWFLACRNNPQNGADGIESSYWFIRDSVMFVAMDTLADEGVDMDTYVYNNAFALQTNWFDRVVSAQKSARSFRYLVVFQHYPHFTYAEGDGFSYGSGRYKKWKDLFDKHKVDFALTGDHHNYSRSKKLRGGSENSEGTVYITAPEIGTSLYAPSVKSASNLNSYGVTSGDNPTVKTLMATAHNGDEAVGGVWFSVTPGKMTMHYIGKSSSPYDTVEVTPKDRGFVYSGGTTGGDATAHTRYRFKVDAPRSDSWCMQLSEIQLLDASGTAIPSNSFTIAYDSTTRPADGGDTYPSNESPPNAVDGRLDTKWLDWRAGLSESAATRSVVWLDFCFDSPTTVYGYRWYTANDAPERTPVSWTFSASDDGGATWTVLDKVEDYDTTTDYNALAYSKRIETPQPPAPGGVHGKWLGGNGGNRFSVAANWDDGEVPEAGDALDFSSVTSATTIEADVNAAFDAVTMGTGVVTFTGNLTATSFSDTSKIAVGANATVTLVGDLTYTTTGGGWMLNRLDGMLVVTGKIIVSGTADMKLAQTVGSSGVAVVKGLVSNGGTSWTFRLNRSNSGDTARWVIGEDGLSGGSGFWMLAASSSSSAILQPNTNDFTIADWVGARSGPSLTVNTTGWGDGVGHVVKATKGFIREGVVTVAGAGTLVCDYDASAGAYGQTAHSVSFNVRDTATMSLAAGSKIGTGCVTVNSGAALSLPGTGTATMGGTLTLQGGSRIVVGAAGAGRPPYLTAKGVSLAGNSITVEIPSQAVGTFTVLTRTDGSFSDTDLAKLSLSVASPDVSLASSLVLADGGKSIAVLTVAAWPANWNGGHAANAAMQTAFTAWAATPGNDATASRAEGAFLLGLDLADYTEDMKIVSLALQGNKFTIDTNVDLTKVRGRLYVLVADSPADIVKSGTKITGTVADITKLVNIDSSAPAKFFKVGVDYTVGDQ